MNDHALFGISHISHISQISLSLPRRAAIFCYTVINLISPTCGGRREVLDRVPGLGPFMAIETWRKNGGNWRWT
jgi:hypothetical protein